MIFVLPGGLFGAEDEDDDLFSFSGKKAKTGGLFSKSKGLFDDDEDDVSRKNFILNDWGEFNVCMTYSLECYGGWHLNRSRLPL